jgi:two-component system, OmpR family, response regulator
LTEVAGGPRWVLVTVQGARVLVVEDDSDLREMLARGLAEEGFQVTTADRGSSAMRRLEETDVQVLIVDIGLPDTDGRDLCQALRAQGVRAPVLFLTARDAVVDKLAGFRAGGNDYVTKPFAFSELVARIEALARRREVDVSSFGGQLRIDPIARTVSWRGESFAVTPTEFRLMATLAAAGGQNVTRRKLVDAAWPEGAIVNDNTLDVYIARLRRKLESLSAAPGIVTAVGVGYRLE